MLPFVVNCLEAISPAADHHYTVATSVQMNAEPSQVWHNVKNVKDIKPDELELHFVHLIGVPRPLSGSLDREGVGGVRSITWEKGIKFKERIKTWKERRSFTYDIEVDPGSIPATTLDEHVTIGGRYFDVEEGGYRIDSVSQNLCKVTLYVKYRVTTNLGGYSKWWADLMLKDFNTMILEVIKKRSESK